jgi:hypothetical protein
MSIDYGAKVKQTEEQYNQKILGLEQQQKLAQQLLAQGASQQGQMVSGHYVPPSNMSYLADIVRQGIGAYKSNKAEKALEEARDGKKSAISDIANQRQQATADALRSYSRASNGYSQPQFQPSEQSIAQQTMPAPSDAEMLNQMRGGGAPVNQSPAQSISSPSQAGSTFIPPNRDAQNSALMNLAQLDPTQAALAIQLRNMGMTEDEKKLAREQQQSQVEQHKAEFNQNKEFQNKQLAQAMQIAQMQNQAPSWQVQKTDNGFVQVNPKTGEVRNLGINSATGKPSDANQHIADAKESNALLDQVEKVGPTATGSGIGSARDYLGRMVGVSTEGSQGASQLGVLGASLTAKVPKMSGPQSDKDVAMYKAAAGNIADPNVPWANKQAAIKMIREINNRQLGYGNSAVSAAINNSSAPQPSGVIDFGSLK